MTTDDLELTTGPVGEQASCWFRVLRNNPTAERHAAFTQWLNASPDHFVEFVRAQQLITQLHRFYRTHHVDVDALIEQVMQEQQSKKRRK